MPKFEMDTLHGLWSALDHAMRTGTPPDSQIEIHGRVNGRDFTQPSINVRMAPNGEVVRLFDTDTSPGNVFVIECHEVKPY